MIRQINRVTAGLIFLLVALIINISYIQVFEAKSLRSQTNNQRALLAEYTRQRGPILIGSQPLANSVTTTDALTYLRTYAQGPDFASVTGYYSLVYGATGIEAKENDILAGNDSRFFVDRLQQLIANRKPKGGAVRLTLNPDAQVAAMKGLAGRTGAVVAINATTGEILAMASSPSFDPNLLSSHDPASIKKTYDALNADPKEPLLNRSLALTLPPGSTFKLVTAAAALESGKYTLNSVIPAPASIPLAGSTRRLNNWTGQACGPGNKTTLKHALAISCNTAFALLGIQLGEKAIYDEAQKFGFEHSFDTPLVSATSHFPTQLDEAQLAMSAIGQFDVRATTLQMALVAAGIANDGVVMRPYLISQVMAPNLTVLQNSVPSAYGRVLTSDHATELQSMMIDVVNNGTGSNGRISGVVVGGKTGTAENVPGESAHAWFVAFAKGTNGPIAVAVMLQHGGGATEVSGNGLAAPIANAVLRAALKQ